MAAIGADNYPAVVAAVRQELEDGGAASDQVLKMHAVTDLFAEQSKPHSGSAVVENVILAEQGRTQTATDDSGTHAAGTDPDLIGSQILYMPKLIVTPLEIPYHKLAKTTGMNQVVDLAKLHLKYAMEDQVKQIASELCEVGVDGTEYAGDSETSLNRAFTLDAICGNAAYDLDPTGAAGTPFKLGGIDSTARASWQAQRVTSSIASQPSIIEALEDLDDLIYEATNVHGGFDTILVGKDIWKEIRAELRATGERDLNQVNQELGFPQISWDGKRVVRYDPDLPNDRAYLLQKDNLIFRTLGDHWLKVMAPVGSQVNLNSTIRVVSNYLVGVKRRNICGVLIRTA